MRPTSLPVSFALFALRSTRFQEEDKTSSCLREQQLFHNERSSASTQLPELADPTLIAQHPAVSALSIDTRPRSKLKPRHKCLFDTNSTKCLKLFNELAIACCESGVVPRKELFETYAAACHIHNTFPGIKRVADLAAGHGLLSWFLLALDYYDGGDDKGLRTAICVDRRMPPSADAVAAVIIKHFPALEGQWSYVQSNLAQIEPHSSCLLMSVHACGTLTDFLIEIAIGNGDEQNIDNGTDTGGRLRAPIAVVPCCHTVKERKGYRPHILSGMVAEEVVELVEERKSQYELQPPQGNIGNNLADVLDEIRSRTLRNAGYEVEEVILPESFTARNRLLMGKPVLKMEAITSVGKGAEASFGNLQDVKLFERDVPHRMTEPFIRIPLTDDPESISYCHSISGRMLANERFMELIPNHFSPSLVISLWLSRPAKHLIGDNLKSSSSGNDLDHLLVLAALKSISNQCCRDAVGKIIDCDREIKCDVVALGEVNVHPETGRRSQRYKFTYKMKEMTDLSPTVLSREMAKRIDMEIRLRIVDLAGDIIR